MAPARPSSFRHSWHCRWKSLRRAERPSLRSRTYGPIVIRPRWTAALAMTTSLAAPGTTYHANSGNDTANGGAGDDSINGKDGIDRLGGGHGNDTIIVGRAKTSSTVILATTVRLENATAQTSSKGAATSIRSKSTELRMRESFTTTANGPPRAARPVEPGAFSLDIGSAERSNLNAGGRRGQRFRPRATWPRSSPSQVDGGAGTTPSW